MSRRVAFWWLAAAAAALVLLDGYLATVRLRSGRVRLPERGTATASVGGLEAAVEVVLDGHGIPHVRARRADDLWLVQGYLEAHERFLQMELGRRAASGRLAELFGPEALPEDIRTLTLRVAATARRQLALLDRPEAAALASYAAGVNAALAEHGSELAPELSLLGVEPEPWQVEDSLAIAVLWQLETTQAAAEELERAVLLTRLGRTRAVDLWGWSPLEVERWFPPIQYSPLPAAADEVLQPVAATPPSSAFAIAPARAEGGRPLLGASLQGTPSLPAGWCLVDLSAPGLHVAGASLPGVPGVWVGHTDQVAWALTPALVDDQDLYALTVDGARGRELVDRQWQPLRTVTERIAVRGRELPELLKVRISERGPVVRDSSREVLALSWTGYSGESAAVAALRMARAGSVAAVTAAWEGVGGVSLHLVAADLSGRVG